MSAGVNNNRQRNMERILPALKNHHFRIDRRSNAYRPVDLSRIQKSTERLKLEKNCSKMADFVEREKNNPLLRNLFRAYTD